MPGFYVHEYLNRVDQDGVDSRGLPGLVAETVHQGPMVSQGREEGQVNMADQGDLETLDPTARREDLETRGEMDSLDFRDMQ
jgi:hypothetical protein